MKLNLFSIATAMLAVMTGVGIPAGAQEDNRDEYRPGGRKRIICGLAEASTTAPTSMSTSAGTTP